MNVAENKVVKLRQCWRYRFSRIIMAVDFRILKSDAPPVVIIDGSGDPSSPTAFYHPFGNRSFQSLFLVVEILDMMSAFYSPSNSSFTLETEDAATQCVLQVRSVSQAPGVIQTLLQAWQWQWLLIIVLAWELRRMYHLFRIQPVSQCCVRAKQHTDHYQSQDHVKIIGVPTVFGRWLTSIANAFFAQQIIASSYAKVSDIHSISSTLLNQRSQANGKPWAIPTRDKFHVCVSTSKQIEEFNQASVYDISLQGAVHELFPPKELYGGMPAGDIDGNLGLSQGIFKSSLRSHLPALQPVIRRRMEEAFTTELGLGKNVDGMLEAPEFGF